MDFNKFQLFFREMGIWLSFDLPELGDEDHKDTSFVFRLGDVRFYFAKDGHFLGYSERDKTLTERGKVPPIKGEL